MGHVYIYACGCNSIPYSPILNRKQITIVKEEVAIPYCGYLATPKYMKEDNDAASEWMIQTEARNASVLATTVGIQAEAIRS
jgi:hypothetical protein